MLWIGNETILCLKMLNQAILTSVLVLQNDHLAVIVLNTLDWPGSSTAYVALKVFQVLCFFIHGSETHTLSPPVSVSEYLCDWKENDPSHTCNWLASQGDNYPGFYLMFFDHLGTLSMPDVSGH